MVNVSVDFGKRIDRVKPMHAVNNGPVYKFAADQRITNIDSYRDAGIPYARIHDASFCATYGGEHTVDIGAIFPDFSKDPYDPASYDFCLTDEYLKVIQFAGAKTFYRLGSKIEHWPKKYGTLPPPDFRKWAVICEHIIRHYNYGWADGFEMGIEYWEIWNEPDLDSDDSPNKRCWGGTKKQFFELYDIAAKHLKGCFPELKIGGPALAHDMGWLAEFLDQLDAPLDFLSWHIYAAEPEKVVERVLRVRDMLDAHGLSEVESILNEWNYVRGWEGDDWLYSLRMEKGIKGAAFIAAVMCACQASPLDMLMYYDARPCGMNGMFNTDFVCDVLKGYYPFRMFNRLYRLGGCVESVCEGEGGYACAAADEGEGAVMLVNYSDDDCAPQRKFSLSFRNAPGKKAQCYLLDRDHDLELVKEVEIEPDAALELDVPLFGAYLVKLI